MEDKEIICDEKTGDKWTLDGKRILSVKLPTELVRRLDECASSKGITRRELIDRIIKEELDKPEFAMSKEEMAEAMARNKARFEAALAATRARQEAERDDAQAQHPGEEG